MTARAIVIEPDLTARALGYLLMEIGDYWPHAALDFTYPGPGVRVLLDGATPVNAHPSALDPSRRADG